MLLNKYTTLLLLSWPKNLSEWTILASFPPMEKGDK